jgi:hypothetical protein
MLKYNIYNIFSTVFPTDILLGPVHAIWLANLILMIILITFGGEYELLVIIQALAILSLLGPNTHMSTVLK